MTRVVSTEAGDRPGSERDAAPHYGLSGHRAVVIGAASGIGRAIAVEIARQGATVVCADISAGGAHDAEAELPGPGLHPRGRRVDVCDESSVREMFASLHDDMGGFDVVINSVGITGETGKNSHEIAVDDFAHVCRVNLVGGFTVSKHCLPALVAQGYGRVLHIASISGKEGNAGMVSYSASKAGLIGMVKAQGKEYAESGVTVNAIAPAVIETPMVAALPTHQVDYMTSKIPMRRTGRLDEVAHLAAFIVSPACSFTTGFTFDLTGGRAVY